MFANQASNKVKILVLKNENESDLQLYLSKIMEALPNDVRYEIVHKKEEVNSFKTAEMIKRGKYDLVLVGENITSSAWQMIKQLSEDQSQKESPIFYLSGKAETVLNREISHTGFSGAVEIKKNGEIVLRQGYGESNRSSHEKNTPQTKFNIASILKMITAVSIVKMVEDNLREKYSNQDIYKMPISELLPKNFPNPEIFRDFTLHELLTHTSGLTDPEIFEPFYGGKEVLFNDAKDFVLHASPLYQNQDLKKRGEHQYCNYGFFLIGFAIQAISGKKYYDFIRENILVPLKMDQTVPRRESSKSIALPYSAQPSYPMDNEPEWLQHMLHHETDFELNTIATNALKLFQEIQHFTHKPAYFFVSKLLVEYETSLNKLDENDKQGYDALREEFAKKLDEAYALLGNRDTNGLYEFNYKEIADQLMENYHKLMQWTEKNKTRAPEIENLKTLLGPEGIYSHVFWPTQVVGGIQINLSIGHPAGCWFSTVDDLIKFMEALWSENGVLNQYAKKMIEPEEATKFGYGYGINKPDRSTAELGHPGGASGVRTACFIYPNDKTFLAILGNDDNSKIPNMHFEIERFLIHGPVRYFDSRITPDPDKKLLDSIIAIYENKNPNLESKGKSPLKYPK